MTEQRMNPMAKFSWSVEKNEPMHKNSFMFSLLLLGFVMAGCATSSVSSNYDRSVDFSKLKTYGWAREQKPTGDPRFDDPVLRETLQRSVETELRAKGLQPNVDGQPDLLLNYYITAEQKKDPLGDYYPPTLNTRGAWAGATGPNTYANRELRTFRYEDGTFVLDMLDPRTSRILWCGSLEGVVDPGATSASRIERVPAAVIKVLNKFPPEKK